MQIQQKMLNKALKNRKSQLFFFFASLVKKHVSLIMPNLKKKTDWQDTNYTN